MSAQDVLLDVGLILLAGVVSTPIAALLRLPAARVVDDEAAHRPGHVAHEAGLIRKARRRLAEREIRLVQQRGGADRQPGPAAAQLLLGQAVQLVVQRREQPLGGGRTAGRAATG